MGGPEWLCSRREGSADGGWKTTPRYTSGINLEDTEQAKGDGRKLLELTKGLDGFRMPCKDCHKGLGPAPKDPMRGVLVQGILTTGMTENKIPHNGGQNRDFTTPK